MKYQKGHIPWMKGKVSTLKGIPRTEEVKRKISLAKMGKIGEKSSGWKGGFTRAQVVQRYREKNRELVNFWTRNRRAKMRTAGTHTLEEWETLKSLYKFMCLCCKRQEPDIKLTEDHIIPITMGGSNDITNVQPLCNECNARKNATVKDYRQEVLVS